WPRINWREANSIVNGLYNPTESTIRQAYFAPRPCYQNLA
ncbi:hypothetical protein, partial [Methylomonas fluvii]